MHQDRKCWTNISINGHSDKIKHPVGTDSGELKEGLGVPAGNTSFDAGATESKFCLEGRYVEIVVCDFDNLFDLRFAQYLEIGLQKQRK